MILKEKITNTLPAFRHRNFRLYWIGQLISLTGTWMQTPALMWLILVKTNSAFYAGLLGTLNFLPVLFFSLFAGILADRVDKRLLILITQTAALIQSLILAVLVLTGHIMVWSIMVLTAAQGVINAVDAPARQSFVSEMVPREHVTSAVAMNSALFNGARVIGPAAAGFLIANASIAACFFINAATFLAIIVCLLMMRDSELLHAPERAHTSPISEIKEGFRYVRGERNALILLVLLAVLGIFGFPALVVYLPVFAKNVLHAGARGMGWLFAGAGLGSLIGAMRLAMTKRAGRQGRRVLFSSAFFGLILMGFSFSRNFYLSTLLAGLAGFGLISSMALTNSTLQMLAPPHLRGRVMSIYVFVMMGMMPLGNFLAGTVAHFLGAPHAVLIAGAICLTLFITLGVTHPNILKMDIRDEPAPQKPTV
jgi:MFS family permease